MNNDAIMENEERIEEVIPSTDSNTFQTTSVALIEKLLQFSTPRLDVKIVNVLFLEGMMDILMTHVAQLDASQPYIDLATCPFEQKLAYSTHQRQLPLESLKRSYHAMEFLSGTTANHLWVQNAKFYDIVHHLFKVFWPNSHANLNHFAKIFQHLVRRHPCDMLDVVLVRNDASILFHHMLPYLSHSSIPDAILQLVFVRDINPETKEAREKCHTRLQELGLLEWLIEAIQMKQHPRYVEAVQEFLMRVIEEASQVDHGEILFKSLRSDKGIDIMESLVKNVIENPPSEERERTINIIKLLVKSGLLSTRVTQPVQGPLYYISLRSQDLLVAHMSQFCQLFIKDRTNAKKSLTTSDMDLLDIIYQTLYNATEKQAMLASISAPFWKLLVNSFFEKATSNIYHTLFYRFVCLALAINDEATLVVLVRKQSLITRLIDTYQDSEKTETRGFILLILNQLRLMADAKHSDLISRIIQDHPKFHQFLPVLRQDTLKQTEPLYVWKVEACPRPPAHLGPTPPLQAIHFSPYAGTLPLMTNINEEEARGIDLGSDYAYCLGFKEGPHGTETPYLSRRNSYHSDYSVQTNHEFPMDIIWDQSLTAPDVDDVESYDSSGSSSSSSSSSGGKHKSNNNKKKKKKKKRKH